MAKYDAPEIDFLSPAEKVELYEKQVPFFISDVEIGSGKYGMTYTYQLDLTNPKTGETFQKLMSLTDNPRRKRVADWIRRSLDEDHEPVGPCVLGNVETDKGNPAWIFQPAPETK